MHLLTNYNIMFLYIIYCFYTLHYIVYCFYVYSTLSTRNLKMVTFPQMYSFSYAHKHANSLSHLVTIIKEWTEADSQSQFSVFLFIKCNSKIWSCFLVTVFGLPCLSIIWLPSSLPRVWFWTGCIAYVHLIYCAILNVCLFVVCYRWHNVMLNLTGSKETIRQQIRELTFICITPCDICSMQSCLFLEKQTNDRGVRLYVNIRSLQWLCRAFLKKMLGNSNVMDNIFRQNFSETVFITSMLIVDRVQIQFNSSAHLWCDNSLNFLCN